MQGFNRYYPPDYDPKDARHRGNLNRLAGKAAARPVVRFEMPFNVWCLNCDAHIAQGVRFNAEKQRTGNYFSSPIYAFRMKCHICTGAIVVATNPKETRYDVLEGAKKKDEEWNAAESGTFEFDPRKVRGGSGEQEPDRDPIDKLEREAVQRVNVKDAQSHVSQLLAQNQRRWTDPYTQSQKLRRTFRTEGKRLAEAEAERSKVEEKYSLGPQVPLLDANGADVAFAKAIEFNGLASLKQVARRRQVAAGPIFKKARTRSSVGLAETLHGNTQLHCDPFVNGETGIDAHQSTFEVTSMIRKKDTHVEADTRAPNITESSRALVDYHSAEDSA